MGSELRNRMNRDTKSSALIKRMKKSMDSLKGKKSAIFKPDIEIEIFRPKAGGHVIDIIPYKAGKNDTFCDPGEETYTFSYKYHRIGPANTEIICPTMYGKPCPACEFGNELYQSGDEESKKYYAKTRHLYNIVSRNSQEERAKGIQIWDVSSFYFEEKLLAIAKIPAMDGEPEKIIDFADPKRGKSISFKIVAAKSKNDYDEYLGHSFVDRRYSIDREILKQAYILDELIVILSYNEIKKLLDGMVKSDDHSSDEEEPNYKKILTELKEIDGIAELEDLVDESGIELFGFDAIDTNLDFDDEKARLIKFLNSKLGINKKSEKSKKDGNDLNIDQLLEKLDNIEEIDDLVEFCFDSELENLGLKEIDEEADFDDEKERVTEFLQSLNNDDSNSIKTSEELLSELSEIKETKELKKFVKANLDGFKLDKSTSFIKQRLAAKKFIRDEYSGSDKKNISFSDVEKMNFEEIVNFVKSNSNLNKLIDLDDYTNEDLEELLLDIKQNWDDIPF